MRESGGDLDARVWAFLDREERELHAADLDIPDAGRAALSVLAIGSGLVNPVVGVVAQIADRLLPARQMARQTQLLRELTKAVGRVEERIDIERAFRPSYLDLLEDAVQQSRSRQMDGKQEYYAAALANSLTPDSPEGLDLQAMMATLADLRPAHLRIIATMKRTRISRDQVRDLGHESRILLPLLPGWTNDQFSAHWLVLQQHAIVPTFARSREQWAGLDPQQLENAMEPYGRRFAKWITVAGR